MDANLKTYLGRMKRQNVLKISILGTRHFPLKQDILKGEPYVFWNMSFGRIYGDIGQDQRRRIFHCHLDADKNIEYFLE